MSAAETLPSSTTPTATRLTHPGRQRLVFIVWILVVLLDIGCFVAGIPDYSRALHSGCLCDYTSFDEHDGLVVLEPFSNGPLASLVKSGDVLIAVDGKPISTISANPQFASIVDTEQRGDIRRQGTDPIISQIISLIDTGDANAPVTLTVRTGDAPSRDVTVNRTIADPTVAVAVRLGLPLSNAVVLSILFESIVFAALIGTAVFIGWKRPDDWMALAAAAVILSYGLITGDSFGNLSYYHVSPLWALPQASVQAISYAILLVFPDGLLKPRWSLIAMLLWAAWEFAIQTGIFAIDEVLNDAVILIFIGMALAILVYRYRHFFPPVRRQQTKWLLFCIGVALLLNELFFLVVDTLSQQPDYQSELIGRTLEGLGYPLIRFALLLIPLGFTFAVLRYRLWDIDLALNRSLVFSVLTIVLGALFIGAFFISERVLTIVLGAGQATTAAAISAAVIVLCFEPVRKRVRTFVDRRIYHFRFDLDELRQAQRPVEITNPGILSGKKLGNYQVLGVLGKGGMGEVYQGQSGTRIAAIKILPPDLASKPDFVKRFEREAQTLAAFNHPNIVKIYDAGQSDGIYYIAMEFVDGQELGDMIRKRGAIPIEEIRPLLTEFAAALDYAHQHGLVHRDIKPSNIMLRRVSTKVQLVLMDFGVAKLQDTQTSLTGTGAIGTIGYMAPEQIAAAGTVDRRADIYALGVVLYEMLTGELPFKGSPAQMLFAHLQQPPPNIHDNKPDIPEQVGRAIVKALAKKPEDRFATVGEFAGALI